MTSAAKPGAKVMTSPVLSLRAPLAKACQRAGLTGLWSVISTPASPRRPLSRAGTTRVSLTTTTSPGRKSSGRSAMR